MSTGRLERSIDPGLRKRLLEAFSRRAESKELHREDLPAALGMAGWAVTKEIRLLIEEAYDSLFQYNTMTQNEFLQFFEHFQALEKQRAFERPSKPSTRTAAAPSTSRSSGRSWSPRAFSRCIM
ncbi:unnamed protein product [Effrenium voratum]|uniref:Uncharacterized protein n=1 Tax=Effrenium voratum TaxID=2562239 RepID=A0AA36NF88_9DINO|nr:unnamed protein product [Effrenium voratum]